MAAAAEHLSGDGLRRSFGGVAALAGVSFRLRRGEILAVVGPNGAGKTTLLNVVTGYFSSHAGRVTLGEVDLTHASPDRIARLGVVRTFQHPRLVRAMSVLENVMIGAYPWTCSGFFAGLLGVRSAMAEERRVREEALRILREFDLTWLAERPSDVLSTGQQRQVELARALLGRPRFLLLDEPAAGLAADERRGLAELLSRLRALGYGILLVEHDMNLVMGISDRVLVLNGGRMMAEGSPDAVRSDPDVIACYLGGDVSTGRGVPRSAH